MNPVRQSADAVRRGLCQIGPMRREILRFTGVFSALLLVAGAAAAQVQGGADWDAWLTAAGVEGLDTRRGPHFNQASVGLEAAADGAGVMLTYPALAASELARGRLVRAGMRQLEQRRARVETLSRSLTDPRRLLAERRRERGRRRSGASPPG
mgnify:CR=1 FL=1